MLTIIKYLILIFTSFVTVLFLVGLMLARSSGVGNKGAEKRRPFECGFLGLEERRSPFSVHFFIISLIFLIFDVELVILFPYLTLINFSSGVHHEGVGTGFIIILLLGLIVEWEKSMLE